MTWRRRLRPPPRKNRSGRKKRIVHRKHNLFKGKRTPHLSKKPRIEGVSKKTDPVLSRKQKAGEISERKVSDALEDCEKNPRSRVYYFIYSAPLLVLRPRRKHNNDTQESVAEKVLDMIGGDFLIQLRALPEDMPHHAWLNFATILLQVKKTGGPKNVFIKMHYKKHDHVLAMRVDGKSRKQIIRHIENLIRRWAYGLKIPAPTPKFDPRLP